MIAATLGSDEIGELLVRRGADVNQSAPKTGLNALHVAAETGRTSFVRQRTPRRPSISNQYPSIVPVFVPMCSGDTFCSVSVPCSRATVVPRIPAWRAG